MTARFAGITISRQAPSLYLIQDKSVTLSLEGENGDQLKVRIGSSWLDFTDYMSQVKARIEREEAEEAGADGDVQADLEDADDAAGATAASSKTKKKKKKSKKKPMELDLDMDNDDASQQTRFAGLVKTPTASEESKQAAVSPKKRRSITKKDAGGLTSLAEVSEDEDSDEESKQ